MQAKTLIMTNQSTVINDNAFNFPVDTELKLAFQKRAKSLGKSYARYVKDLIVEDLKKNGVEVLITQKLV